MSNGIYEATQEVVTAIRTLEKLSKIARDEDSKGILKETLDFLQSRIPETRYKPFICKKCQNGILYNRNGRWGCEVGCTDIENCMSCYKPVLDARKNEKRGFL